MGERPPAPNMVDRLFLQTHNAGLPGQLYWVLEVDSTLDVQHLREAFGALLSEAPVLGSRIETTTFGFRRARGQWPREALNQWVIERAWRDGDLPTPESLDLSSAPPLRLVVDPEGSETTRLCLSMHHSVGDAFSALYILERLGHHYRHTASGVAVPPPPKPNQRRGFRTLFTSLRGRDRLAVLTRGASTLLGSARSQEYGTGTGACATFADHPSIATSGQLRYAVHPLPWSLAGRLMRVAVAQHSALTDVLLAATVVAGAGLWPHQDGLPVLASVPMSTRDGAVRDICNRALPNNIVVPWSDTDNCDATLSHLRNQSARVRGIAGGLVQATERSVLSLMPPSVAARLIGSALDNPVNTRETLTFTSLGSLEPVVREFAGMTVSDAHCAGSLLTPPGLKVAIVPSRAALNIVVHWVDGVTESARAMTLGPAIHEQLDAWVARSRRQRQNPGATQ